MTFNPDKNFTTRDGRKAEIAWRDGGGDYPLIGRIQSGDHWDPESWTVLGLHYALASEPRWADLVNTPEPPVASYVNVYPAELGSELTGLEYANLAGMLGRVALIRLLRDPDTHAPLSVCLVDPQTGEPI